MRQLRFALLVPVIVCAASVGNARAATMGLESDNCGTPPLLGLTIRFPTSLVSCGASTLDATSGGIGSVFDMDTSTPLYGNEITSITLLLSVAPLTPVTLTPNTTSIFNSIVASPDGTSLFISGPGFLVCTDGPSVCPNIDLVIGALSGFAEGTTITVTAVNGAATAVPEPATLALVSSGLAAVLARRRSRLRSSRESRL